MSDLLKIISTITFLTLIGHFLFLLTHNQFRIKKLLKYFDKFKKDGRLSDKDFELLQDRYTSFFNYLEFYPDKEDFKTLYENPEFEAYIKASKWKIKYCSIVIGISTLILLIVLPFNN